MANKHRKHVSKETDKFLSNKFKWINYCLTFLFLSGLVLTVFEINIFRKTLIDWKIPTGIWFGTGFISLVWLRTYLVEYYGTKHILLQLVFSVCSFGGLFTYGFMASNYYLLDKNQVQIIKTTIIETGHLAKGKNGCGNPYARVDIKGTEKELVFPCGFEIDKYKSVSVKLQGGLFGFDRLLEQTPEND